MIRIYSIGPFMFARGIIGQWLSIDSGIPWVSPVDHELLDFMERSGLYSGVWE